MKWLNDAALERLREAADVPDLQGTRYRLVDKLGQGGMGGVYRVEDSVLGREVALKVISLQDPDGSLSARLLQEARVIAKLEHPGIVPVHDAGILPDGRAYYVMKLVQGKRLDDYVREVGSTSDRLRLFLRLCDAVAFAHAHGVLHRDLKPSNVMVGPFGEVLVMDWGLAKVIGIAEPATKASALGEAVPEARDRTAEGSVLGTPGYMAPEQIRGSTMIDQKADVYSLGAILQFLMLDRPKPRALAAIQGKAMANEAQLRYSSVEELSSDVAHFLDGQSVSAHREGPLAQIWRWAIRNRTWLLLLLAYVVTRALLIVFRPR